jgi:hypothetical protein
VHAPRRRAEHVRPRSLSCGCQQRVPHPESRWTAQWGPSSIHWGRARPWRCTRARCRSRPLRAGSDAAGEPRCPVCAGCSDGSVYCVHACLRALCVDAVPLVRSSINHSRTARDKSQRGRLQSDFTDWACCNAPSSAASRQCLHRAFIGTAYVRGDALTSEELRGSLHDAGCARNECAFLSVSW